jgi:hypothetical protein
MLCDLERANISVAFDKLQRCYLQMSIVGYVTSILGRHPDFARVEKLVR